MLIPISYNSNNTSLPYYNKGHGEVIGSRLTDMCILLRVCAFSLSHIPPVGCE